MKLPYKTLTYVFWGTVLLHQATLVVAPESFRERKRSWSMLSNSSMKKHPELSYTHFRCHNWRDMNKPDFVIEKGDVIACLLSSPLGTIVKIPHWLMALNDEELIHLTNPASTYYVGAVTESSRQAQTGARLLFSAIFGGEYLENGTWDLRAPGKTFDQDDERVMKSDDQMGYNTKRCLNLGNGGYDPEESYLRALRWWRHVVWYHAVWCSCQHWVFYWVTGDPGGSFANFPHFPVSSQCKLSGLSPHHRPGSPFKQRVSYKKKWGLYYWDGVRPATEAEYQMNLRFYGGTEEAVTGLVEKTQEDSASSRSVRTSNSGAS